MAANALGVEPVADVDAPSIPIDSAGQHTHASTIYQLQLAFMARRMNALEAELETERERRHRLRDRYEQLLAERDEEIRSLQCERDASLLSRLRR